MAHWQTLTKIKELCIKIFNDCNTEDISQLQNIIQDSKSRELVKNSQQDLLATFYLLLRSESQNKSKLRIDDKIRIIQNLGKIFSYIKIENIVVFFNFFGYLLQDIYDSDINKIKSIQEEHKLAILSCVKCLLNSTSSDLTFTLYTKQNGRRLCKMIYVAVEIALHEKYRSLRVEAIECLMAIYKVHSDFDYGDPVYRSLVAESFSFFLPGVASCLQKVALKDEKVGFKLIKTAIKALGRILSLLMQDYKENDDNVSSLEYAKSIALSYINHQSAVVSTEIKKNKIEEYMEDTRNPKWFSKSDRYISNLLRGFRKLTQHQVKDVRKELAEMCYLFIENCSRTMPISHRYIVDILIILSEDQEPDVSQLSRKGLEELTLLVSDDRNRFLINTMQDGFYDTISQMPVIFNGIDDQEKLAILKLASGYVNLFGKNLLSHDSFRQFMHILLHLCEFEIDISTFNENAIQDLENDGTHIELWKNLKFLKNESVRLQFTHLCHTLVKNDFYEALTDFLITFYQTDEDKKEVTYLLNEIISGLKSIKCSNKSELIKPLLHLYIYPANWNLPITNHFDGNLPLRTLRNNIQQGTLNVHGIGVMADVLQEDFRPFLLKSLFLVLTRAGSNQPLIQTAGRKALKNIANALNYSNVTALINNNMDYFVFYIERNLKNDDIKGDAFNVMEIVMMYGNKDTLENLLNIVQQVLLQSCDKFKQKE
ncbi:hypothetical protein WA026_004091 [Henosepilachna vigintioctopunctata]|uniref:TTI1 N-terminal TPR domain-containing protein n=1 Tax=Henosepilachna vigintioctopunctata TaxID=420089 RepID=A0AAW1UGG0_9CUCU